MKIRALHFIIALMLITLNPSIYSQRNIYWKGNGGWGHGDRYAKMYDPKTVEAIHGAVLKEDSFNPAKGMSAGLMLTVKTTQEEIPIHVGPVWFVENQDIDIDVGDIVDIIGSRVTFEGKQVLLAKEITKGDLTLKLRDDDGFPYWSAWRKRK